MNVVTPPPANKVIRITPNKSAESVHLEVISQLVSGSNHGMVTAPGTSVEFQNIQVQISADIEALGNMDILLRSGIPSKPVSLLNLGTRFHLRVEELSQPKF